MTHASDQTARTVAILGATGGTGKLLVQHSLDAGHRVIAIVRDPARLGIVHERLRTDVADVTDAEQLARVLREADAVLSALGSAGGALCEPAMAAVIEALGDPSGARIIAVSAQPVARDDDGPAWWHRLVLRPIVRWIYRTEYADLTRMEGVLRASATAWTVLRPPYLTDGPPVGTYRLRVDASPPHSLSVTRADVALATLAILDDPSTHRRALGIASP